VACAEAGREASQPVGKCGETVADPRLAAVLVRFGITPCRGAIGRGLLRNFIEQNAKAKQINFATAWLAMPPSSFLTLALTLTQ